MVFLPVVGVAQNPPDAPRKIQDNSLFVEEAYNQEPGVVQHISNLVRLWESDSWGYTFTQEWPLLGQKHQFSFTFPMLNTPGVADSAGIGDLAINYRYQLMGSGETPVAVAPRLSLLLPTGSSRFERGAGGTGFELNLPVSVEVGERVVTHWNAGTTLVSNRKDVAGNEARTTDFSLAQSVVWLAHPRFNFIFETAWDSIEETIGPDTTARSSELFLVPGFRWAHNFASGLQIVPAIGVPFGVGSSSGERGLLLYLSFEHPFRRE
jgi:hypothetical protein